MFENKCHIKNWCFLITLTSTLIFSTVAFAQLDNEAQSIIQLLKSGDNDAVISQATEYLKAHPNNVVILSALSEAYMFKNDLDNSERYAKRAIEIELDNSWACKILAKIYRIKIEDSDSAELRSENLTLAEKFVERGLRSKPNDIMLLAEKAQIYFAQGVISTALEVIEEALRIAPDDAYLKTIKEKIEKGISE